MPLFLAFFLALAWSPLSSEERWPACVRETTKGTHEPATLDALLECQERSRNRIRRRGASPVEMDRFDDFQRREVRDYLARHPRRATLRGSEREEPGQQKREGGGIEELDRSLREKGGDGRLGITPAMARDITEHLQREQGGMTGEMSALLNSLQRDGPRLSDESALRLKRAARKAKANGLELGIDPGMERWLLDPAQDPDIALPEPPSN